MGNATQTQERQPFVLDHTMFGTDGERKPINAEDTTRAIVPFTEGKAELALNDVGQVSNTASPEMRDISPEKRNLIASMIRSF